MRHQELTDHIRGSFLKRQFLEAFLVQSAYIESLIKLFVSFKVTQAFTPERMNSDPLLKELDRRVERYNLNELIDFLYKSKAINDDQKKLLNEYRGHRNRVLHDLITEISKTTFENELKEVCEKGNKIIDHEDFKNWSK